MQKNAKNEMIDQSTTLLVPYATPCEWCSVDEVTPRRQYYYDIDVGGAIKPTYTLFLDPLLYISIISCYI